ncbi:hypothetical protein BCF59_0469 [Mycoplasmopsis mustelae]|uniref:Transmembrane protein n=1 Tax=Mycoplasmopsis mustelae TaxID=171289 RepID=A0A4R7UEJ0_9BACT|nr:hypothetical protein [Mycoplasmopsis mustelae]TDV24496.1 hypothetical protein BCF59_0469 [Mycoplasmopsis mustelae]
MDAIGLYTSIGLLLFTCLFIYPIYSSFYIYKFQYFYFIISDVYKREKDINPNEYHHEFVDFWKVVLKYSNSFYKRMLIWLLIGIFWSIIILGLELWSIIYQEKLEYNASYILAWLPMFFFSIITLIASYFMYIKCLVYCNRIKFHFREKFKFSKIIYNKPLLNSEIYFNNSLKPNNYIPFHTFIFDNFSRFLRIHTFKKLFKDDAYSVFGFFIYNMHKSRKEMHKNYFKGLYNDYVNFYN